MSSRCCCGQLPVTTGAQIIAVLLVLGSGGANLFQLIAAILVFFAVIQTRAALMIPIFVYMTLLLVGTVITFILSLCMLLLTKMLIATDWIRSFLEQVQPEMGNKELHIRISEGHRAAHIQEANRVLEPILFMWIAVIAIVCVISFIFNVWFLVTFKNCYKHLKEMESVRTNGHLMASNLHEFSPTK